MGNLSAVLAETLVIAAGALALAGTLSDARAGIPEVDPDGTIHIQELVVPLSELLSPEARRYMAHLLVDHPFAGGPNADADIAGYRAHQDEIMRAFLQPMQARYHVKLREERIGGIIADVVTPADGVSPTNAHRVLLNVHGGGFISGARTAALVESIPIAATMKIKVVSIDYRLGPEAVFPAASEDVAAVYREVLKQYRPGSIGLYGCSAGGLLTAQSIAWFHAHGLPMPGAIGVLCASLGEIMAGDAASITGPLNGFPPDGRKMGPFMPAYYKGVSATDPLVYPIISPELLKLFPPTILVTATRSLEFSAAINSHNALVKAGVNAELHVWDGLFHGFFYNSELPESREVYDVLSTFFGRRLTH